MRSLILGNGIDIEFGGKEYSNWSILERVHNNIVSGKYTDIFKAEPDTILKIFDGYRGIINKVIKNEWNITEKDGFLFLLLEMKRVQDMYSEDPGFSDLGLEDYFLGHELSCHILGFDGVSEQARQVMQMIILDAIFNDGKINEIHKFFPDKLRTFLEGYDAIFTLNYDTNIDTFLTGSVPVYHLHGCFDDTLKGRENEPAEWKHMYCNGIMTWYWLEKYGQEHEDVRYGIKEFAAIEDKVDIIGISACNDEQLFLQLSQNPKLKRCDFYYYDDSDAAEIKKHLSGSLQNHITVRNVQNYWEKIRA